MSKRAVVVVFGDISQSPRMMNHAKSLVEASFHVDVVGYCKDRNSFGENFGKCRFIDVPSFKSRFHSLKSSSRLIHLFEFCFALIFKSLCFLFIGLFRVGKPDVIITQNPPFIPTLLISPIIAKFHSAKYIIDWHNFSYTIASLSHGQNSKLIKIMKTFELLLGRLGQHHIVVSRAMKEWIVRNMHVPEVSVDVVYDRPTHRFHHLNLKDKHDFLTRFFLSLDDESWGDESPSTKVDERTGEIVYKTNSERNQALVVSSTSWTADEDFGILWQAILDCEHQLAKAGPRKTSLFPTILLVITGKGPLRSKYEDLFKSQHLYFFKIKTVWLSAEDYPKLLASADLGISLHCSSSGLDLPMKVVDMMGSGLPVLSYKYNCIAELIIDEENGFCFEDADHLAQQLLELFHGFPKSSKTLKEVADNLLQKPLMPWKGYWEKNVLPIIKSKPGLNLFE